MDGIWPLRKGHIRGHLWHRLSVTVDLDMMTIVSLFNWYFILTTGNSWFSSFLVNNNPISRSSCHETPDLTYRMRGIHFMYWNVVIFTMWKLRSLPKRLKSTSGTNITHSWERLTFDILYFAFNGIYICDQCSHQTLNYSVKRYHLHSGNWY